MAEPTLDEQTLELQAIRQRLEEDTGAFKRSVEAWQEYTEREARWRRNCPPAHRQGHHLRLSRRDGLSHSAKLDRQTTAELTAERFTHAGLPDHSTTVWGLRDVGDQTLTREQYRQLYG